MNYIEEFNNSYERILGRRDIAGTNTNTNSNSNSDAFFHCFYELFVKSDKRVAEAFATTDMDRQIRMLRKSLVYVVNMVGSQDSFVVLQKIAETHSRREHNIHPELYDIWMDCLVAAAREFDPYFSEDSELGWRLTLAPAVAYMKHIYPK